ncbi:succinate dehydrogenase, cytochrome b556 subunit [Luminiphilus syltensis NOR5-1B]|uniref:Succinate dehydrogenase cytochrome b556 subunit n=2 Tax=Luminiphilus TaxID=1341118 RepID=B8KRS8_9GAMM|nr:succinate dehydrogenase, cytochrome b556 subunit [Luminiphilus syltensis NOR5-1B]
MKLPVTAWASIAHRVSGVALFGMSILMVWALDASLASEQSFNELAAVLSSPVAKAILWLVAVALTYHSLAGVKHIVMDFGYGETLEGGVFGARLVIVLAVVAAVVWGLLIW